MQQIMLSHNHVGWYTGYAWYFPISWVKLADLKLPGCCTLNHQPRGMGVLLDVPLEFS